MSVRNAIDGLRTVAVEIELLGIKARWIGGKIDEEEFVIGATDDGDIETGINDYFVGFDRQCECLDDVGSQIDAGEVAVLVADGNALAGGAVDGDILERFGDADSANQAGLIRVELQEFVVVRERNEQ